MQEEEDFVDTSGNDFYFGVNICDEILAPDEKNVGGLYLGRVHFLARREQIKSLKIGAILSAIDSNVELHQDDYLKHMHIHIEDDSDADLFKSFNEAYDFLEENLAKTNVFVHCQMGISRSSSLVIVFLMRAKKMGFESALNFLKSKRECVRPNVGFINQLKQFEKQLSLA